MFAIAGPVYNVSIMSSLSLSSFVSAVGVGGRLQLNEGMNCHRPLNCQLGLWMPRLVHRTLLPIPLSSSTPGRRPFAIDSSSDQLALSASGPFIELVPRRRPSSSGDPA